MKNQIVRMRQTRQELNRGVGYNYQKGFIRGSSFLIISLAVDRSMAALDEFDIKSMTGDQLSPA